MKVFEHLLQVNFIFGVLGLLLIALVFTHLDLGWYLQMVLRVFAHQIFAKKKNINRNFKNCIKIKLFDTIFRKKNLKKSSIFFTPSVLLIFFFYLKQFFFPVSTSKKFIIKSIISILTEQSFKFYLLNLFKK